MEVLGSIPGTETKTKTIQGCGSVAEHLFRLPEAKDKQDLETRTQWLWSLLHPGSQMNSVPLQRLCLSLSVTMDYQYCQPPGCMGGACLKPLCQSLVLSVLVPGGADGRKWRRPPNPASPAAPPAEGAPAQLLVHHLSLPGLGQYLCVFS